MGVKAESPLELSREELAPYLSAHHSAYMQLGDELFYLTDVNDHYWRVQCTSQLNDKGHYTDCSELVPTIGEFLALPFKDGKSVSDLFEEATFFASEK